MASQWWRRALQQRLGTVVAAALLLWTLGTAIAATVATSRITDAMIAEREARAGAIATRVERALDSELRQLDLVAPASAASDDRAIDEQVRRLAFGDVVIRVGRDGNVLWARSVVDGRAMPAPVARFAVPPEGRWRAEPTPIVATTRGPRAFLVIPARESDAAGGAVAAAIAPDVPAIAAMFGPYVREPYRVALEDAAGRHLAASRASETRAAAGGGAADDLAAVAPVSGGGWRIRVSQPRTEALGPVLALRRTLVGSSLLLLPFAVIVALGTARSIRRPVLEMTAAAERLARGEFSAAIPPAGEDEIGRLAMALDQLRTALQGDERRSLLLRRVMSAQEEERRRVARELHDETTQQLTALGMQLDSLSAAQPQAAEALAGARALLRSTIDDVHRLIHDLRPSMLDDLGLLPAIRAYAQAHLAAAGAAVHCEFPAVPPEVPREAATALYRVMQEAITNVARHAKAEAVMIACTTVGHRLVLEVEDDGVGFEPALVQTPHEDGEGLGLLGMRERLALLGGTLAIESEPGRGTRVVATLSLAGTEGA